MRFRLQKPPIACEGNACWRKARFCPVQGQSVSLQLSQTSAVQPTPPFSLSISVPHFCSPSFLLLLFVVSCPCVRLSASELYAHRKTQRIITQLGEIRDPKRSPENQKRKSGRHQLGLLRKCKKRKKERKSGVRPSAPTVLLQLLLLLLLLLQHLASCHSCTATAST